MGRLEESLRAGGSLAEPKKSAVALRFGATEQKKADIGVTRRRQRQQDVRESRRHLFRVGERLVMKAKTEEEGRGMAVRKRAELAEEIGSRIRRMAEEGEGRNRIEG